jgi:cytochrome c oxidase assembly factor CtaG
VPSSLLAAGASPFHLVGSSHPTLGLFGIVTDTTFHPIPLVVLVAASWAYARRVRRVRTDGGGWEPWRSWSFALSIAFLAVATLSGLDRFERSSFIIVGVQHSIIGLIAPVFLAISSPILLLQRSASAPRAARITAVLSGRAVRVLTYPLVPGLIYMGWFFLLYFTPVFRTSLSHASLWDLDNLILIVLGFGFAWPLVANDPMPRVLGQGYRILWILLLLPYYTILGMSLESQGRTIAPGVTLPELHAGGGVIWVVGEFLGVLGTIAVLVQWCRLEETSASTRDRVLDHEAAAQLAYWKANRRSAAIDSGLLPEEELPAIEPAALSSGARLALGPGPSPTDN